MDVLYSFQINLYASQIFTSLVCFLLPVANWYQANSLIKI